jgi:hypothetical protein
MIEKDRKMNRYPHKIKNEWRWQLAGQPGGRGQYLVVFATAELCYHAVFTEPSRWPWRW